jgi:putative FmdB family regulatory protein
VPLYEYQCQKCHHRFERIESAKASEVKKCPKCGGKAKRQLTAPAIQFKGSGWYVTDYAGKGSGRSDGSEKAEGAAKPEAKEGAAKGEKVEKKEATAEQTGTGKAKK